MAVNEDDYISRIGASRTSGGGAAGPLSTSRPYSASDPPVFWGYESQTGGSRPAGDRPGLDADSGGLLSGRFPEYIQIPTRETGPRPDSETPRQKTLSESVQEFYLWDEKERRKWGEWLVRLALIAPEDVNNYKVLEDAWKEIVQDAANLYAGGAGHKMDPWQTARFISGDEADRERRRKSFADEAPFTGTKTQVSSSVDLTDPTTAKAVINDVLSQMLGRAANPEELSQFTATLNAAERANPTKTTTTGTYQDGDLLSSSSVSSGGVDRGQVIQDRAMNLPDYGAFQASTTYADALFRAIQSPI